MSHDDDNDTKIEQTKGLRATRTMKFDDFKDSLPPNPEFEEHEATLQMGEDTAERIAEASGGDINGTISPLQQTKRRGHPIIKLLVIVVILAIAGAAAFVYTQGKDALLGHLPEPLKTKVTSALDRFTPVVSSNQDVEQEPTEVSNSFDNGGLDSEIVQAAPEAPVDDDFNPTEIIEKAVEDNSSEDVNLEMLEQQMRLLEDSNIDNIDESIEALNNTEVKEETEKPKAEDNLEMEADIAPDKSDTSILDEKPAETTDEIALIENLDVNEQDSIEEDTAVIPDGSLDDGDLVIAEPSETPLPTPEYQLTATDQKIKKFIELYKINSSKANELAMLIGKAASENNLEALLVAAICAAESSFDPNVVSDSGKIGLMQLSNSDAKNIINLSKGELSSGDLKDPAYNLKVGLWYIKFLQYYYKGDLQATLAAYEMGQKEYEQLRRSGKELPVSTGRFNHNVHNVYKLISGQNPNNADKAFKNSISAPKEITSKEAPVTAKAKPIQVSSVSSIPVLRKIIGYSTKDEAVINNLEKLVIERSNEKSFDPILIASIIMAESSFKPDSVSDSGKIGLLQIDPERAQRMAKETGMAWSGANELLNPDYNLELGIAYLSYCTVAFPKDFKAAILCFNAGEEVAKDPTSAPAYTAGYIKNLKSYFKLWGATLPKGMKF